MNLIKLFFSADKMPVLRHGGESDEWVGESAAVDWLCAQPEIRAAVFFLARNYGVIGFDPEAGGWRGRPDLRTFMPFSEAEVKEQLEEPKRMMSLMWALMDKYERPVDQYCFRIGLGVLVRRGILVMKEYPGYRGRKERWYGLSEIAFADADSRKPGRKPRKRSLSVETVVRTVHSDGPLMAGELVKLLPESTRSVVYDRLREAKVQGLVAQDQTLGKYAITEAGGKLVFGTEAAGSAPEDTKPGVESV